MRLHIIALALAIGGGALLSCGRIQPDYYVCAYVWPSCHDDSLAHKWLWDDTPRFPAKGEKHVTRFNHSPEVFSKYLQIAKDYADAHRATQPPFVMVNAWNEWVEGSYLLPDKVTGYGYLEAVKSVFN